MLINIFLYTWGSLNLTEIVVLNFLFGRYRKTTKWCILSFFLLHFFNFYKMMTCPITWCYPSRVSLGCCINLHCAMLRSVHWSTPIEPSLSKWICRKKSAFSIKNTERRAEIFLFSFFLSFNLSWVYLFETDWANVQTKLLFCATNVQRCNVEDGKARWFICSVFNDCLAPLASVSTAAIL